MKSLFLIITSVTIVSAWGLDTIVHPFYNVEDCRKSFDSRPLQISCLKKSMCEKKSMALRFSQKAFTFLLMSDIEEHEGTLASSNIVPTLLDAVNRYFIARDLATLFNKDPNSEELMMLFGKDNLKRFLLRIIKRQGLSFIFLKKMLFTTTSSLSSLDFLL